MNFGDTMTLAVEMAAGTGDIDAVIDWVDRF